MSERRSLEVLDPAALLKNAGLRVTQPRVAVLIALNEQPHAATETLVAAARTTLGTVSVQAVYDVIAALLDADLIRRVDPAGATAARYEINLHDNHHHLVCRSCRKVVDVPCAVGHRPCLTAATDHGFRIDESEVTYWGLCPTCQTTTS